VAITIAEGMKVRRHVVGADGYVQGQDERWVVADGQVRQVG